MISDRSIHSQGCEQFRLYSYFSRITIIGKDGKTCYNTITELNDGFEIMGC